MRIEPLGDKVVVKRLEADEKTAGGIVLPDSAREKPQQGRVLSVGEGRQLKDGGRALHQVRTVLTVLAARRYQPAVGIACRAIGDDASDGAGSEVGIW